MSFLNIGTKKGANIFRKRPKTTLFSFAFLAAVLTLGTTFTSNISLNDGSDFEFGQGVAQYSVCDPDFVLTALSTFVDGPPAEFKFSGLTLTGIDTTDQSGSTKGCANKSFTFTAYNQNGAALSPTITLSILSDGEFSSEEGTVTTVNPSSESSTATFSFEAPSISAESVYRFIFESKDAASCSVSNGNSGWTKLYEVVDYTRLGDGSIDYVSGYGLSTSDAASSFDSGNRSIRHIRYQMLSTINGTNYYANVCFDAWSGVSAFNLQVPDAATRSFILHKNVENLTVGSNYPGVVNGTGLLGRLEIWPGDYAPSISGLLPSGDGGSYDYDDTPYPGGYGSFQVHNLTNQQTVFAWNNQGNSTPNLGFGNGSGHPDWTFDWTLTPQITNWKLQIFVN